MLPKVNRLKHTKEISRVFKEGRGCGGGFLFLKLTKNNLDISRFAFVISSKTAKKASWRNKIKRRLRDSVKSALPLVKTGFDVVVIAQKGIFERSFQEIKNDTAAIFRKAGILA